MRVEITERGKPPLIVEVEIQAISLDLNFVSQGQVTKKHRTDIAERIAASFATAFPDQKFKMHFSMLLNGGLPGELGLAH